MEKLNDYIFVISCILVSLFATKSKKQLPKVLKDLFKNTLFKIVILSLLLILLNKKPHVAILVAIIFVVVMEAISNDELEKTKEYMSIAIN